MLHSLRIFKRSEVAQQRMKIIRFYEEYGEKATRVRRSIIHQEIINFIKDMREKYFRMGKEKLKPGTCQ